MKLDSPSKKTAAVAFALFTIGLAAFLIYKQRQPPKNPFPHHRALGRTLAEETAKSLEHRDKKRVLIITAKSPDPMLRVQFESFMQAFKQHPELELKETVELESDAKHRIALGHGLSARRFVRLVEKNLKADAIVSFVGVPDPGDADMNALAVKVPRFLAETGDRDRVQSLIEKKMLRVAVVPRYEFPAPIKEPQTEQEWFDKYFQIIRAPKSTNDAANAKAPE